MAQRKGNEARGKTSIAICNHTGREMEAEAGSRRYIAKDEHDLRSGEERDSPHDHSRADTYYLHHQVSKIDFPTPTADEIVVKVHALAINPVDWKMQDMGLFVQSWPTVLGCDVAGEVHEVGSGVTRFKKGDRVFRYVFFLKTIQSP